MPNRNYEKGARLERQAVRQLRDAGYAAHRVAGSKGLFDVFAFGVKEVRFIQVKGDSKPSAVEREAIEEWDAPEYGVKEVWVYYRGNSTPVVEVVK